MIRICTDKEKPKKDVPDYKSGRASMGANFDIGFWILFFEFRILHCNIIANSIIYISHQKIGYELCRRIFGFVVQKSGVHFLPIVW